MAIEWDNTLATGVDVIDSQHKELFSRINTLFNTCHDGRKEEAVKTLKFLENYVVEHFSTEETTMIISKYPGYPAHKGEHLKFMEDFAELKKKFDAEGPNVLTMVMLNGAVVDWLRNHIRKTDKALGAFLKSIPS